MTAELRQRIREAQSKAALERVGRVRCECGHCDTCYARRARAEGKKK